MLVLFLNEQEGFHLFTVEYDVGYGFIVNGLYCVELCSFCAHLGESYHEWILNFIKCFFCIY